MALNTQSRISGKQAIPKEDLKDYLLEESEIQHIFDKFKGDNGRVNKFSFDSILKGMDQDNKDVANLLIKKMEAIEQKDLGYIDFRSLFRLNPKDDARFIPYLFEGSGNEYIGKEELMRVCNDYHLTMKEEEIDLIVKWVGEDNTDAIKIDKFIEILSADDALQEFSLVDM
eukprot:TRINITY_DN5114_c0_g1_i1.p2 TRINITY_DN5114_c0_g1~~TRINITY_DN5114_c0_g1_i1.p2  ORF type:complete len:171 (+),score=45.76 TRINITY_DN5114_c0_g1_i1:212-724(+)